MGRVVTVTRDDGTVTQGPRLQRRAWPLGLSLQLCEVVGPRAWGGRAGFLQLAVERVGGVDECPYLWKWLKEDAHFYLHSRRVIIKNFKKHSLKNKYVKHTENIRCCTNVVSFFCVKICHFKAVGMLNLCVKEQGLYGCTLVLAQEPKIWGPEIRAPELRGILFKTVRLCPSGTW